MIEIRLSTSSAFPAHLGVDRMAQFEPIVGNRQHVRLDYSCLEGHRVAFPWTYPSPLLVTTLAACAPAIFPNTAPRNTDVAPV